MNIKNLDIAKDFFVELTNEQTEQICGGNGREVIVLPTRDEVTTQPVTPLPNGKFIINLPANPPGLAP